MTEQLLREDKAMSSPASADPRPSSSAKTAQSRGTATAQGNATARSSARKRVKAASSGHTAPPKATQKKNNHPVSPEYSAAEDTTACAEFKRRFDAAHAVMCFLLDYIPSDAMAGLELSSFRRLALFQKYLGLDHILLLTRNYQSRGPENALRQIELDRFSSARVLNMYDYLQGINRADKPVIAPEPQLNPYWRARPAPAQPRDTMVYDDRDHCVMYIRRYPSGRGIDYINYLCHDKIYRRDTYDVQGFLSRTEFIEPASGFSHSQLYYRPDHTVALTITCRQGGKNGNESHIATAEITDAQGRIICRCDSEYELVSWWLLHVLDKSSCYLLIGDENDRYQEGFRELKRRSAEFPQIRVIAVSHNAHTMDPLDPLNSKLGDNFLFLTEQSQRIDAVVTLTSWQKEDVQARYGDQAHPITVIPHSLPDLPDSPGNRSDALPPHSLILVGRLTPSKGQEKALRVLQEILHEVPDTTLHFYGAGSDEPRLKSLASELGIADKAFFHGFVNNMTPVYRSAALMLSCSDFEGFPLVVQEALMLGCPVVAFNCRYGPSAMIEDGKNGYLVEPGDTAALAANALKILKSPALRGKLSRQAIKSMSRFAKPLIAARWARLLTSLLPAEGQGA